MAFSSFDRNLPGHLIRLLLSWYKTQSMSVRWGESFSTPFTVSNGVRQGGVLSPILFTLYLDDLLVELRNLGVSCFLGSFFAGALCYADDLVILAPSPSSLRLMLNCCEGFAARRGLLFNPAKTKLVRFSSSPSTPCSARFHLCGHMLSFQDTVTHLGNRLHFNLSDSSDIHFKLRKMGKKANYLFASFPRLTPPVITHLFQFIAFPFMAVASGLCHLLPFTILKLHSINCYAESGTCPLVAIRPLSTSSLNSTAYSMWFIAVPLPFLKLPPDVLPLLFVLILSHSVTLSLAITLCMVPLI